MAEPSWPIDDARHRSAARRPAAGARGTRRRLHRRARLLVLPAVHVVVLTTFAFAQPLFDLLGRNAEFFTVRGSTRSDLIAFTLGAVLIPPALLLAVEALAMAVGALAWLAVHLVIVGGLAGALVLAALHARLGGGAAVIVVSALAGLGASAAYLVVPAVRSVLTVLAPAPLIVSALFLFNSPVSKLVTPEDAPAAPAAAAVDSRAPVVLILFDEFGTNALLDGRGRIDAKRYPNFARLAGTSAFYRDATTVHSFTQDAVPSILTGRLPVEDSLAMFADHPENIFTLLQNGYRLRALEWLTRICPPQLCPREAGQAVASGAEPGPGGSLASDVTILYLHTVVPSSFADRLPPVEGKWGNFRAGGAASAAAAAAATEGGGRSCAPVCRFVAALSNPRPATLYYLHLPLPHAPWVHRPSGRSTVGDMRRFPEALDSGWGESDTLTEQAYARYLLQVGATDRALGLLFEQLDARRIFDDALIVAVADHGLSFELGAVRREASAENMEEVAFVPLFVKLPHQRRGAERTGLARTIDVVPTIADALGVEIPWPVDGESLLGRRLPPDGTVTVEGNGGRSATAALSDLLARRDEDLRWQVERFGTGTWEKLYASGPLAGHVGRSLAELAVGTAPDLSAELDGPALLQSVDLASGLVPAYITGRVADGAAGWELAVAVNGRVTATTRTYQASDGVRFAAVVPDDAIRDGSNEVEVLVSRGGPLERVPTDGAATTLSEQGILRPDGTLVPFSDAIRGSVSARFAGPRVTLRGWAADLETRIPREEVAIFVDGVLIHTVSGPPIGLGRPPRYDGITRVSFDVVLPAASLPERGGEERVQVFALAAGRAAELEYEPGYPWHAG